jgi:hypothetical protein
MCTCVGVRSGDSDGYLCKVCVHFTDAATMLEFKSGLSALTGVQTRTDTRIWTTQDEGALKLWDAERHGAFGEPAVMRSNSLGWAIPTGYAAYAVGKALSQRGPILGQVVSHIDNNIALGTQDIEGDEPPVGASGASRSAPEPVPAPDTPIYVTPAPSRGAVRTAPPVVVGTGPVVTREAAMSTSKMIGAGIALFGVLFATTYVLIGSK